MEPAAQQQAQKNIEILLNHIQECSTRRSGTLQEHDPWIVAAVREHGQYAFAGILVRSTDMRSSYLVAADRLAVAKFPAWTPPAPPVPREAKALADALAPLLRSAAQLRFVDPYFDAEVQRFLEPMKEYLRVAQNRRKVEELRVEIHFAVTRKDVEHARRYSSSENQSSVASRRLAASVKQIGPLVDHRVHVRAFAWGENPMGEEMHNRYVLTEVGGVEAGTGLDARGRGTRQTEDLTILSKEQHAARWSEFSVGGTAFKSIATDGFFGIRPRGT
jgi:hypothetical protein